MTYMMDNRSAYAAPGLAAIATVKREGRPRVVREEVDEGRDFITTHGHSYNSKGNAVRQIIAPMSSQPVITLPFLIPSPYHLIHPL
jgi:predicted pyridoxine 5'-phosphate oxidase superfamily flavin-nucleotide-binding protein